MREQKSLGFDIRTPKDSGSIGRNYELGVIKHCPNKSFVFILKKEEEITEVEALTKLSVELQSRRVLGAYVGVSVDGSVSFTSSAYPIYNKPEYNGQTMRYKPMNQILNHLRVFHSDCYKIIPQFALRSVENEYFNDRFTFVEQFVFMVANLTKKHDDTEIPHTQRVKWFTKINSAEFDIPNRIHRSSSLVVKTAKWE